VQATYLGYPGSTGVPNIDWLIGDAVVTPPEEDALCSERVARLPGVVFCFAPETDYPLPNWDAPEFLARPITFGSFNNVRKLTPRKLALWARVLSEVPGSRLVLKAPSFGDPGAVRAFSQRLAALGADLARVEFRGPVGLDRMMAEYADIDIALDPTPYNGGTTSLQAMWMGVPVLTLYGQHFVSRMGASFMRAARLPDWVVTNEDDYVRMARCMAADRRALLQLKRSLRGRLRAAGLGCSGAHAGDGGGVRADGTQPLLITPSRTSSSNRCSRSTASAKASSSHEPRRPTRFAACLGSARVLVFDW